MRNLGIGILIGLAAAAVLYWTMTPHQAPVSASQALPAEANAPQPAITGNYADDWQTRCGPLTAASQTDCTAKLDTAYGRKAEVPVPKN